jgi:hypothetical protein
MLARVVIVLGRSIFFRESGRWQCEPFDLAIGSHVRAVGRLNEILSVNTTGPVVLIYEPEGMAHESVETPKVNRTVFASLARIRRDHPVVSSVNVGWGIEWPEPAAGGTYSTLLHSELSPGLVQLKGRNTQALGQLSRTWTLYTVIEAMMKGRASVSNTRHCIVLTPGFAAVAACGMGRRSFRAWTGIMSERDWDSLWTIIVDPEERSPRALMDPEPKETGIVAVVENDPTLICPFWSKLNKMGKVETVLGLDELAEYATKLSENHPGNLLKVFPKSRELKRHLIAGSVLGISLSIGLIVASFNDTRDYKKAQVDSQRSWTGQEERLECLKHNQREMLELRSRLLGEPKVLIADMHAEMLALESAIPDSIVLRSIVASADGKIEVEAFIVGPDFDSERARAAFEDFGFFPDAAKGWSYNTTERSFKFQGTYLSHRS